MNKYNNKSNKIGIYVNQNTGYIIAVISKFLYPQIMYVGILTFRAMMLWKWS